MGDRLRVTPTCLIGTDELSWRFTPSGGPGGQHANRSSTRVEVTFDIAASPSLTDAQRSMLIAAYGDELRVGADDERSQLRNRSVAQDRLIAKLAAGLFVPTKRKPSKPSKGAKRRRLEEKKRQGDRKRSRSWRPD